MPEQTEMIRIEGLKKVYGTGAGAVTALDGIDLSILKGDIHGIIGMSGAGKSTLIRCVNRLDTPAYHRAMKEAGIQPDPGHYYFMDNAKIGAYQGVQSHFRLNIGAPRSIVEEAVRRLRSIV